MQKVAVLALLRQGDKYLIVKHHRRKWDLPGGYVHQGEDIISALNREIYEETGFSIKNIKLKFIYSNLEAEMVKNEMLTKTIFAFTADYKSGDFRINQEVTKVKFIEKNRVVNYINNELLLRRFNDLTSEVKELTYVAYKKTPYVECVRKKIR